MNEYNEIVKTYQPVIGLEIHVQLSTKTKMFSACKWGYGESPNTLICPLTMAFPGTLPVINEKAVEKAIMIGKALNCKINNYSEFSRKHYFYPDLPKGYQISQFDKPICGKGYLDVKINSDIERVNITRAHLEEDAGKLIHSDDKYSLVDYNRSGAPLIEIVTEPDFRDPELVNLFLKKLKKNIEYIGASDCNMEKGNLRVDLNVSVMKKSSTNFGNRREIKNLNSFKSINKAIKYEVQKQVQIIESGMEVKQSTMIWDESTNSTHTTREKEDAHDYRYFPEPDLSPLELSDKKIDSIIAKMPELPDQLADRLKLNYNLNEESISFLLSDKYIASYFEEVVDIINKPILVIKWIKSNVMQVLNREKITINQFSIIPTDFAELMQLIDSNQITKGNAIKIFDLMLNSDLKPSKLMFNLGLEIETDNKQLNETINLIFEKFPDEFSRFKSGEKKLIKFFMGQVMKETKGKYPPKSILEEITIFFND